MLKIGWILLKRSDLYRLLFKHAYGSGSLIFLLPIIYKSLINNKKKRPWTLLRKNKAYQIKFYIYKIVEWNTSSSWPTMTTRYTWRNLFFAMSGMHFLKTDTSLICLGCVWITGRIFLFITLSYLRFQEM